MTLADLIAQTRFISNTSTITYPDADLTAALNTYVDLFTTEVLNSMDDWDFSAESATTSLVANQQEYLLPLDILKIKRIEVSMDGVNWYVSTPMDVNETGNATDADTVTKNFYPTRPKHDLMDNSIILYPIPDTSVTAGLKIWYEHLPAVLASSNDTPNLARPFHKGLCYGAAKDYFEKYLEAGANSSKAVSAGQNMETYIARMNTYYRKKDQDRPYNLETNFVDYGY
jgi:hypothetical protein